MSSNSKQIIGGATISYALIIINALYSLVITPYVISHIGDNEFGVYKAITAFAASLMVIDLGLGGTVQRYIANFRANNRSDEIGNYVFMSIVQASILSIVAVIAIIIIHNNIYNIFHTGFSISEINLAKKLFLILGITIVFHLFEDVLNGVITGFERFIFSNGLRLCRIIVRFITSIVFITIWKSSITLVIVDCVLVIALVVIEIIYICKKTKLKIKFTHFNKAIFKESIIYSLMMFVTSLSNQLYGNIDNIAIGAFLSSKDVAIYSIAIILFNMFSQIGCSISGVLLPKVSFLLKEGRTTITNYIIRIGRIQYIVLGGFLSGYILLGREFIQLWMGNDYIPAYYVSLIIMTPALFELCINIFQTILRATNKLKFKTIVTVAVLLINAVITFLGVKYYGFYMAAIATAIGYIVGPILTMSVYYQKEFKFKMLRIYKEIFINTTVWIVLCYILTYFLLLPFQNYVHRLLIGVPVFLAIYCWILLKHVLVDDEKLFIYNILKKKW